MYNDRKQQQQQKMPEKKTHSQIQHENRILSTNDANICFAQMLGTHELILHKYFLPVFGIFDSTCLVFWSD